MGRKKKEIDNNNKKKIKNKFNGNVCIDLCFMVILVGVIKVFKGEELFLF